MEPTYNPLTAELAAQALWEQHKVYTTDHNPGPLFSIDTPPPTVSGALHIGHVFSYTQADIIARYKRMQGFSVFYPFGFDDNGLPTERYVEKKCGVSALRVGRTAFIELCLEQTALVEKDFEHLWRRMGLSIDWSLCYSTISSQSRRLSQQSFIELYKKGFLYRKEEPAPYCPVCHTSVAQAELEDAHKQSVLSDVTFTSSDGTPLVIATTRPELIASCVAVLYNPTNIRYQHLKNTQVHVPLYGFTVPILEDERVLIDKGTGLVMCSTFGDKTDVEWFKKFKLPYRPSIDRSGRMTERAGFLAGKKVAEARQEILHKLKEEGLIVAETPITHTINVHERCKNAIEYLALAQWFLKLLPHKETFLELGNRIAWYPDFMKFRYSNWVENISWDWCLSRQRFFGIPFPVWYCTQCQEIILADEKSLPIDPQEQAAPACTACGSSQAVPDTDVMDTWNTSSLTPYICRELYQGPPELFIPMSMRPQAHDIIRTWAFDTIVKAWMHDVTIPWQTIVISGHVQTTEGQKISKSQANSPLVPENLLKLYPADVIRYWTASASLGSDIAFSETQLKIGQRLAVKLWNAFRFISEHINEHQESLDQHITGIANLWIIERLTQALKTYHQYFDSYQFNLALEAAERFFWHDFCDNYLELVKDLLFNPGHWPEPEVASTRAALAHVGMRILQLFAAFMPHITETLYGQLFQHRYKAISLHQVRFAVLAEPTIALENIEAIPVLLEIVTQVRKLKSDQRLSLKTDLRTLYLISADAYQAALTKALLSPHERLIAGVTRAQKFVYQGLNDEHLTSSLEQREDGWHAFIILAKAA